MAFIENIAKNTLDAFYAYENATKRLVSDVSKRIPPALWKPIKRNYSPAFATQEAFYRRIKTFRKDKDIFLEVASSRRHLPLVNESSVTPENAHEYDAGTIRSLVRKSDKAFNDSKRNLFVWFGKPDKEGKTQSANVPLIARRLDNSQPWGNRPFEILKTTGYAKMVADHREEWQPKVDEIIRKRVANDFKGLIKNG